MARRRRTHIHGVRIEFSLSHSPAKEGACAVVICCFFCFLLVPSFVSVCFLFSWVILIVDRWIGVVLGLTLPLNLL